MVGGLRTRKGGRTGEGEQPFSTSQGDDNIVFRFLKGTPTLSTRDQDPIVLEQCSWPANRKEELKSLEMAREFNWSKIRRIAEATAGKEGLELEEEVEWQWQSFISVSQKVYWRRKRQNLDWSEHDWEFGAETGKLDQGTEVASSQGKQISVNVTRVGFLKDSLFVSSHVKRSLFTKLGR